MQRSATHAAAVRCMTVILSALLVIASLSLTSCSFRSLIATDDPGNDGNTLYQPDQTDQNANADNKEEEPPEDVIVYYNPLTGLACETDLSTCRPVSICFYNTAASLPQYGLEHADILIEAPVENGSTRLCMITNHYASIPQFGQIASSRNYLLSLSESFGAVSVCAGTSDIGTASKAESAYEILDESTGNFSTVFFRRGTQNALFTSGTRLAGAMESFLSRNASLPYQIAAPGTPLYATGTPAGSIVIPFSSAQTTQFYYDTETGLYTRVQNGTAHTPGEEGDPLTFTNLLLLTCEYYTHHTLQGTEMELDMQTGGRGEYIAGGFSQDILWARQSDGTLCLTDLAGEPLTVNAGKTYIGLLDLQTSDALLVVR